MSASYDKTYNLKTRTEIFEEARVVFSEHDTNVAQALNLFLKNVAMTGEVNLLSEEELERLQWAKRLQEEIKEGIESIESGQGLSLEEARRRFGL